MSPSKYILSFSYLIIALLSYGTNKYVKGILLDDTPNFSTNNRQSYQLYDLSKDSEETTDLSDEFPEIKNKMVKQLIIWSSSIDQELEN